MSGAAEVKEYSDGEQCALRDEVRRLMGAERLTQSAVCLQMGAAVGTWTQWLGGTYKGDNQKQAALTEKWLRGRAAAAQVQRARVEEPPFVMTPTAELIWGVLEEAQFGPDFGVFTGEPGLGKTEAILEYQRRHTNVFLITGEPVLHTPRAMLDLLALKMGVGGWFSSQQLSWAIQQRLQGSTSLIVMDEAQHFSTEAIDQLRTLFDLARCGIALIGNGTVFSRLQGCERKPAFAQLHSRIGTRHQRRKPTARDVAMLIDAWGVEDAAQRRLLTAIAVQPGALRSMSKTLKRAHALAQGEALTADLIESAWGMVGGRKQEGA